MATISNSASPTLDALLEESREAVRSIGTSGAVAATAFGTLSAAQALAYQNDPYWRQCVDRYLATKGRKVEKNLRQEQRAWLLEAFELVSPGTGAKRKDRFMFNNRVSRIEQSFRRAVGYQSRGLKFIQDGRKTFVTKESYADVMKVPANDDVEVTTFKERDAITWTGLMPRKERAPKGNVIQLDAAHPVESFKVLCEGVMKITEAVNPERMGVGEQITALRTYFAVGEIVGAAHDRGLEDKLNRLVTQSEGAIERPPDKVEAA